MEDKQKSIQYIGQTQEGGIIQHKKNWFIFCQLVVITIIINMHPDQLFLSSVYQ